MQGNKAKHGSPKNGAGIVAVVCYPALPTERSLLQRCAN